MSKKCFIISPIGDDQTDVREEADALLWITQNALAKYGFEVIRVDQIARSTVITNEIIQLIQESELCVIILTGQNPNVFYEAGRRHETAKPFIQLIRKGETLPFDVAGIRTIIYENVDTRASAAKTIEELQKYIEEFEKAGYGTTGTGVSLSTLAASLDRIERKVGQIMSGSLAANNISGLLANANQTDQSDEIGFPNFAAAFQDPRESFLETLLTGNLSQAATILPRLEGLLPSDEFTAAALMLVQARHEPAVEIVIRMLTDHIDEFDDPLNEEDSILKKAIGGVTNYYSATNHAEEGQARLEPIVNKIMTIHNLTNKDRAFFKNQIQKLLFGIGKYEQALEIAEEVISLNPEEKSYYYNASLIYEKLNLLQKSVTMVDKYLAFDADDADHLHQAVEVYVKTDRIDDAKKAFVRLKKVSALKAMAFDNGVMKKLGAR